MDVIGLASSLVPIATVIALIWSAWNTFRGFRRADAREHFRWLQKKRREAYVKFLSATRKASRSISQPEETQRLRKPFGRAPVTGRSKDKAAAIFDDEEAVSYALDVVVIVGPKEMARQARQVEARLKLDRLFYSPKRAKLLLENKDKYVGRAKVTGDDLFANRFAQLYDSEPFDMGAYEDLHAKHPLRDFWSELTRQAEKELAKNRPDSSLRRLLTFGRSKR